MESIYLFGGFQMKTIAALLIIIVCGAALFAQETAESSGEAKVIIENKGIFSTIIDGFAESTRIIHEINKENMAAVKEESKTNFKAAAAPNAGIIKLRETKGFWNKVLVIFENMMDSANEIAEKESAHRADIRSHNSYRSILENQRVECQSAKN